MKIQRNDLIRTKKGICSDCFKNTDVINYQGRDYCCQCLTILWDELLMEGVVIENKDWVIPAISNGLNVTIPPSPNLEINNHSILKGGNNGRNTK